MGKSLLRFLFLFIIVIVTGYCIHIGIINAFLLKRNMDIIHFSYLFNSIFTIIFIITILLLSKKIKDQLGFVFMAGSLIKIGFFMGITKLAGYEIHKNIFLDFFIAYAICLILEVYCISKTLNYYK